MSLFARVVFVLLVAATFSAFFAAQRLKSAPPVATIKKVTNHFSPNGDGRRDVARFRIRVRRDDDVTVSVVDEAGSEVRRIASDVPAQRERSVRVRWDGRTEAGSVAPEEELRWLWLACHAAIMLWDYESWDVLSRRQVALARDSGALTVLPIALSSRIGVHLNGGDLAAARSLVQELEAITAAAGTRFPPYGAVALSGWEGHGDAAARLIEAASQEALAGGEGMALTFTEWMTAVVLNGQGRYRDALRSVSAPMLLSQGAASHPFASRVVEQLACVIPSARRVVLADAGHVPHMTHPDAYTEMLVEFVRST